MIAITGAAGFIGSYVAGALNRSGVKDIVIADDFSREAKLLNYSRKSFTDKVDRINFPQWLAENSAGIECVLHLGARTDTTETDWNILEQLNLEYSKRIWEICTEKKISLIYASSAATYGAGEHGYDDDFSGLEILRPLNLYGKSKNEFDKYVLQQTQTPPFWTGLKFFNVYGPNEYHKQRMASVIFHAFNQIKETGKVKLFRSHRDDFRDGGQKRDFIYVKDIFEIIQWMMQTKPASGIYNAGTGEARTFYDLAESTAGAMRRELHIEWIDIPSDIRENYQYFTEANMNKLRNAGYTKEFYSLEEGIHDYVYNYLAEDKYF